MRERTRGVLSVVWDFDSAVGQVNSTFPYHFRPAPLDEELAAVADLRAVTARLGIAMTFATVGLAAEDVAQPFGAGDELRSLHGAGHEVASHSWRHEWLPHLTTQQLRRSLLRSKLALERCIGAPGAVVGFVPPFNRPMTWLARGEVHPGDRWAVVPGAGATLDSLVPTVARRRLPLDQGRPRPAMGSCGPRSAVAGRVGGRVRQPPPPPQRLRRSGPRPAGRGRRPPAAGGALRPPGGAVPARRRASRPRRRPPRGGGPSS